MQEDICPKCGQLMTRRWHKVLRKKDLEKAYLFAIWYVCKPCNHIQHHEKYKMSIQREENV